MALPTIRQLDQAIAQIIGQVVYEALKTANVGRTRLLDIAIIKAFVEQIDNEFSETLRICYKELQKSGVFPAEMWLEQ